MLLHLFGTGSGKQANINQACGPKVATKHSLQTLESMALGGSVVK